MRYDAPPPRGDDREFLRRLDRRIDRERTRWRTGLALAAVLAVGVAVWPRPAPERPIVEACEELREDPVATILLEAARMRLDGLGDPASARPRLERIVKDYAGTRAAVEAAALLEGEQG